MQLVDVPVCSVEARCAQPSIRLAAKKAADITASASISKLHDSKIPSLTGRNQRRSNFSSIEIDWLAPSESSLLAARKGGCSFDKFWSSDF